MIGPRITSLGGSRVGPATVGEDELAPATNQSTTMTLAIADSASPTPAGNNFTYTATPTNTGSATATSVSVAITLDASLTYVSSAGSGWVIGAVGQVVTATRASIASSAAPTFTITVTAGNATATVTTTGAATGANFSEADATHNTSVVRPTTSVTITPSSSSIVGGLNETYTISFTNSGAGTVHTISAAITLDAGLTYVSSSGTGWSIGVSGQVVTATMASLGVATANDILVTATTPNITETLTTTVAVTCANAATANASSNVSDKAVTKDATSGIYAPASATEFTNLGVTAPTNLWLMQEASGNLADTIGSNTLTASGSGQLYQQAVSGWTRKAVRNTDGTANQKWTASGTPNPNANSLMFVGYWSAPASAPGAVRGIAMFGTTTTDDIRITTNPHMRGVLNSVTNDGSSNPANAVRPLVIQYDRTNSAARIYTDQETVTQTYSSAVAGASFIIGATGATPCAQGFLYSFLYTGSAAELTTAQVKTMLQTLGFTIAW